MDTQQAKTKSGTVKVKFFFDFFVDVGCGPDLLYHKIK